MKEINLIKGSGAGPFLARNILGHEPCHDFNPAGVGRRMCKLNKIFDEIIAMITDLNPFLLGGSYPPAVYRPPQERGDGGSTSLLVLSWPDNIRELLTNQLTPEDFDQIYGVGVAQDVITLVQLLKTKDEGRAIEGFKSKYSNAFGINRANEVWPVDDYLSLEEHSTVKLSDFMHFSVAGKVEGFKTMQTEFSVLGLILATPELPIINSITKKFLDRLHLTRDVVAEILRSNITMDRLRQSQPSIAMKIELLVKITQAIAETSAYSMIIPLSILTNYPQSGAEPSVLYEDMRGGVKHRININGQKKGLPKKIHKLKPHELDKKKAKQMEEATRYRQAQQQAQQQAQAAAVALGAMGPEAAVAALGAMSPEVAVIKTADMYNQFNLASKLLEEQFNIIEVYFKILAGMPPVNGEAALVAVSPDARAAALVAARSMIEDEDTRTQKFYQRIQPSQVFIAINHLVSAFRDGQLESVSPVGPFFASNCDFVCNGMMLFFMDILSDESAQQSVWYQPQFVEELWILSLKQPASSGTLEDLPDNISNLGYLESILEFRKRIVNKIDRIISVESSNGTTMPAGANDIYSNIRPRINERRDIMGGGSAVSAPKKKAYWTFMDMLTDYTSGSSPLLPGYSAEAMALMKLPVLPFPSIGEIINNSLRSALTSDPNPESEHFRQLPTNLANQSLQGLAGVPTLPMWEPGENQESSFSFYTPNMIYYINRAILFYQGKWPGAEPDTQGLHQARGAGGECERCKNMIRDELVGVVIPRLFQVFEGMVTGSGNSLVEDPNIKDLWEALKIPLVNTMKASITRAMNGFTISKFLGQMAHTITSTVMGSNGKLMVQCPPIVALNRNVINKIQDIFLKFNTATKIKSKEHPLAKALKAIPMQEALKAVSQPLRNFANTLLREQCRRIQEMVGIDGIPVNANKQPSKEAVYGYWGPWKLWYAQGAIIDKVAQGKGIGDIDESLLNAFKEATFQSGSPSTVQEWTKWVNKVGLVQDIKTSDQVWDLITKGLEEGGVGITNNAHPTKIPPAEGNKLMLSVPIPNLPPGEKGEVGIDCDSGSVCDAMGSFGSCFHGKKSPNYSCQTKNIKIVNDGFTFKVHLECIGNNVKCNYNISYNSNDGGYNSGGKFYSHVLSYKVDIGISAVNTLSANNTMHEALKIIQQQIHAGNLGSTATFEELFKKKVVVEDASFTRDFGYQFMATLSNKAMGDWMQGLHVLAENGGVEGGAPLWKYRSEADGDTPSFVKNSVLALCSSTGIDRNSSLFYTWLRDDKVSGLFVYATRRQGLFGGGGKRRTHRKHPSTRKTRRKGQKTKHKKTRNRKQHEKKPPRERKAHQRAKTKKRFVFRK